MPDVFWFGLLGVVLAGSCAGFFSAWGEWRYEQRTTGNRPAPSLPSALIIGALSGASFTATLLLAFLIISAVVSSDVRAWIIDFASRLIPIAGLAIGLIWLTHRLKRR